MNRLRLRTISAILAGLTLLPSLLPAQTPADISVTQAQFDAARKLYNDGRWVDALAAFQKFERVNKFSTALPDSIFYQGWCWFNQQRYAEANNLFERLLTTYPTSILAPEATLKRAECYRGLKQFGKAAALYREFQQKYPKDNLLPQAILGEAFMRFKDKDLAGAKVAVNTVRERYPDDALAQLDALFLLGQILTEEKSFDEARKVYRQIAAQRSNPRATEGLYLAGEAMYEAKRYTDAIAYYKSVRSTAELIENINRQLNALVAQRGDYIKRDALSVLQSQISALQQLQTQIRARPDLRASALFRIANCYQSLGKPEEASVVYRYLLEQYPNDRVAEQANFGLIQTLTQRGQLVTANSETEAFKRRYPKSLLLENATLIQAEALYGQQNYRDALPLYGKSLAAAKDSLVAETVEFRTASCYFNLEQFAKARDGFAAIPKKYPQGKLVPEALFRLGQTYYEIANRSNDPKVAQPNLIEATKAYEEVRANHPQAENVAEATFRLAYLHSYLGAYDKTGTTHYDQAIALFKEFAQKWPNHALVPEALYQIARNQVAAKRYDNAIAAYRSMLEKFPDHPLAPFVAFEIAGVCADAKKFPEMVEALREYVRRYPEHGRVGDALYAIGTQLEAQKKNDEAIAAYRELVNRAAKASPLTPELRDSAIGAELRIAALLEPASAAADCESFLAKFASDPTAARTMVSQIASLYRKGKKVEAGYAELEQLARQYQTNPAIRIAGATSEIELALDEKDFTRANAAAARLLADPEHDKLPAASYAAIGNTFLKSEKFAPARNTFEKMLTLYASDARSAPLAQLGLGQALLGLKQYEASEAALNKMIAADPQNPARLDADLALAKIYEATGKTAAAVNLYNKVLQNARGDISFEASFRAGMLAFNDTNPVKAKDNKKLALGYFARLLFATGPMAEEAAYRAGECQEALGNMPQACAAFQGYAKRFSTGRFVAESKSKIARLCVAAAQ